MPDSQKIHRLLWTTVILLCCRIRIYYFHLIGHLPPIRPHSQHEIQASWLPSPNQWTNLLIFLNVLAQELSHENTKILRIVNSIQQIKMLMHANPSRLDSYHMLIGVCEMFAAHKTSICKAQTNVLSFTLFITLQKQPGQCLRPPAKQLTRMVTCYLINQLALKDHATNVKLW